MVLEFLIELGKMALAFLVGVSVGLAWEHYGERGRNKK